MAVILDLDMTLVDSSSAAQLRANRNWSAVYRCIPSFRVYDGVHELLDMLASKRVPTCIVTSAPEPYCCKVLQHFSIEVSRRVCYHDTRNHKPDPEPIELALTKLESGAVGVMSIGDDWTDIKASRAAGVEALGALWGASDRPRLMAEKPDRVFAKPEELHEYLCSVF